MSAETETAEEETPPPTLTEAVAAMTADERGEDAESDTTTVEDATAKTEPKPSAGQYQATARRAARESRKLDRVRADLDAKERGAALAAQERAELEEARALAKLAKDDPAAYAEKTGLDIDRMTSTWLANGKPDAKVSALEKRLDAEKAEREEAAKDSEAVSTRARIDATERTFVKLLEEKADEYPAIADMDAGELFDGGNGPAYRVAREIKAEMDRLGYAATTFPTDDQIMAELNAREALKIEKRAARLGYARGEAPASKPRPAASGKTIQGSATRQRAAVPPPEANFNRAMTSADRATAIAEELAKESRRTASGR